MTPLKWIVNEAKKIKKQHPHRFKKWTDYVAQASAIYASKHKGKSPVGKKHKVTGVKKKVAKKKAAKKSVVKKSPARMLHKDTKSHNVNIRVMSGINKDVNRSIDNYKRLELEIKEAQKNYNKAKDFTARFYAKQKLDKLKYELRERKFVLTNLSKELKKIK